MNICGLCLFFVLVIIIQNAVCDECKAEDNQSTEKRLMAKLMCNYDNKFRPVLKHDTVVNVTAQIMVVSIKLTGNGRGTDDMELRAGIMLVWKDEFLMWNPDDYDGIETMVLGRSRIWTPPIAAINSEIHRDNPLKRSCIAINSGHVHCMNIYVFISKCSKDYKYWPFDKHSCTLSIGGYMSKTSQLNFHMNDSMIRLYDPLFNKDWKITDAELLEENSTFKFNTFPSLEMRFKIERIPHISIVVYLMPTAGMIIVGISSVCYDIGSIERMLIILINLHMHMGFSWMLSYFLPFEESTVPNAIQYFRSSWLLNLAILIQSVMLQNLLLKSTPLPLWVKNTMDRLMGNIFGKIIMFNENDMVALALTIRENEENEENLSKKNTKISAQREWNRVALVLNRIFLICVCLAYAICVIKFFV